MGSNKAFLLLGLSLAIVLLISSEVAARELAETQTTTTNKNTEAATVDGRDGYNSGGGYNNGGGGYHNGGGGYHNGGGGYNNGGGGYNNGGGGYHNGGGGYHNGGGGYHNGGGHGGGGGGCRHGYCRYRCCNYAGEVVNAETTEVKPHN